MNNSKAVLFMIGIAFFILGFISFIPNNFIPETYPFYLSLTICLFTLSEFLILWFPENKKLINWIWRIEYTAILIFVVFPFIPISKAFATPSFNNFLVFISVAFLFCSIPLKDKVKNTDIYKKNDKKRRR